MFFIQLSSSLMKKLLIILLNDNKIQNITVIDKGIM